MKFSEQAKADGFRDGDIIIKVDDKIIESWSVGVLQDISNAGTVTVLRNGSEQVITIPEKLNLLEMLEEGNCYAEALIPLNVDSIEPGMPASEIGLKRGDVITSVNGNAVSDYNDFVGEITSLKASLTKESNFADSLKARTVTLVVNGMDTVKTTLTSDFKLGFMNKMPYGDKVTTKKYGFVESLPAGVKYGWRTMCNYTDQLKYLFTKKGASQVGGFISIGNVFPDVWDWHRFWLLTAFLSIILGVMNLLPIPALDGGHALFATFELITRRRLNDNFLLVVQYFGMWIILAIMILAQANDIMKLFGA